MWDFEASVATEEPGDRAERRAVVGGGGRRETCRDAGVLLLVAGPGVGLPSWTGVSVSGVPLLATDRAVPLIVCCESGLPSTVRIEFSMLISD